MLAAFHRPFCFRIIDIMIIVPRGAGTATAWKELTVQMSRTIAAGAGDNAVERAVVVDDGDCGEPRTASAAPCQTPRPATLPAGALRVSVGGRQLATTC